MSWLPTLFELIASLGAELFLNRAMERRPAWLGALLITAWLALAFALAVALLLLGAFVSGLFR